MKKCGLFINGLTLAQDMNSLYSKGLWLDIPQLEEYVLKQIEPQRGISQVSHNPATSPSIRYYLPSDGNTPSINNLVSALQRENIPYENIPANGGEEAFPLRVVARVSPEDLDAIIIMSGPKQTPSLLRELKSLKPDSDIYLIFSHENYKDVSPEAIREIAGICKGTFCLESMFTNLFDISAQAVFRKIPLVVQPNPSGANKLTGKLKVIDRNAPSLWAIVTDTVDNSGDYYFTQNPDRPFTTTDIGKRVSFTVTKPANPSSLSGNRRDSNGVAEDVKLIDPDEVVPTSVHAMEPSIEELKDLICGCTPRKDGYVLMSELGLRYRYKGYASDRPIKALFAEHSDIFEMIDMPALSVRIK